MKPICHLCQVVVIHPQLRPKEQAPPLFALQAHRIFFFYTLYTSTLWDGLGCSQLAK